MTEPITLFTKLPALPRQHGPCLNCCPAIEATFDLDREIAVGFGGARLSCDGETVFEFDMNGTEDLDGHGAEALALKKPNADWRIKLDSPLHGETYQRHGPGRWVLVEKNEGFA